MITKAFTQNKILVLVQVLRENNVDSKKKLEEKWNTEPKYLLSALSLWIERSNHKQLLAIWPPLDSKILPPEYLTSAVENEE